MNIRTHKAYLILPPVLVSLAVVAHTHTSRQRELRNYYLAAAACITSLLLSILLLL
jgi:hypothetical protein